MTSVCASGLLVPVACVIGIFFLRRCIYIAPRLCCLGIRFGIVCVYGGLDSGSYSTLLLSPFVFIMFFFMICELRRVLSTIVLILLMEQCRGGILTYTPFAV